MRLSIVNGEKWKMKNDNWHTVADNCIGNPGQSESSVRKLQKMVEAELLN